MNIQELKLNSTPLVCACEQGNLEDVKLCITGHDVEATGMTVKEMVNQVGRVGRRWEWAWDCTPLMAAAQKEHFHIVQYLIEQCEADPNIANYSGWDDSVGGAIGGWNALHVAAESNRTNTDVIQLLLTHMSINCINKRSGTGSTPLDRAYEYNKSPNKQEIIDLIRKHGGKREKEIDEMVIPFINACRIGLLKVKEFLTSHDVNGSNGNNMTLKEMVNLEGAFGTWRCTPLEAAAQCEHFDLVQYLIKEGGADPNIAHCHGENALHAAAWYNKKNTDLIKFLLKHMSLDSINQKDSSRWIETPVDRAYRNTSSIKQEIIDLIRLKGGKSAKEAGGYVHTKKKSSKKKLPGHPPTNIQELSHHKDFAFVLCHVADKNSFLAYDRKHVIEDKWNLYGASMKPSTLKNAAIFTFHEHGHSKNGGRGLSYSSDPYMGLEVNCRQFVDGGSCQLLRSRGVDRGCSGVKWVINGDGTLTPDDGPRDLVLGFGDITYNNWNKKPEKRSYKAIGLVNKTSVNRVIAVIAQVNDNSTKNLLKNVEMNQQRKYTAVRLEMKNDALSGCYTNGGTSCSVDCYQFELYGPHRLAIKSGSATGPERPLDTINDLVNGTGRKRWCAWAQLHEVQSATFVLEMPSTITHVVMKTSGDWAENTRHTLSRLIGIAGDGHEQVILDWTDKPNMKSGKFVTKSLNTSDSSDVHTASEFNKQKSTSQATKDLKLPGHPTVVLKTDSNNNNNNEDPFSILGPGCYRILTTEHADGKQRRGWGLSVSRTETDCCRNDKSTWVCVQEAKWLHMVWNIVKGKKQNTWRILTTGYEDGEQPANWGLSAWNTHGAIRNKVSSWTAVHSGDHWPMDWKIVKGKKPNTWRLLTTKHDAGKQPENWGLSAWNAHGAKRNAHSSRVAVHEGDHWPMDWVFQKVETLFDVKPKGKKLPMKKSAATSLIPPVNVENRNKYFENHKVKLKGYENEMKEMIKSNEYNIDLLNRFTQYLNSFEVDAYDKCLPEYDFYKGGDTVTVKFFCDDFIDEVYYNNVNIRGKVEGNVNGCCTWKTLKFVGRPRAVLAIACNDNQPGTSASFAFIAKSSDPDSPWNFSSFPNDQSGRTYKLNCIAIHIYIY